MNIDEIRIYAEVLEQGLDFKEYIKRYNSELLIKNIYTKKISGENQTDDSVVDKIRKIKDIDVLITAVSNNNEYPLLIIEYSTAVPTDDHKMQRSDVCYWSAKFKTPMMKISPVSKGMEQEFGGGAKFTDELEIAMACKNNAVMYFIPWENEKGKDYLAVKEDALSCIAYSKDIDDKLRYMLHCFLSVASFDEYFSVLQADYVSQNQKIISYYTTDIIKEIISESTRFNWFGDKLRVKINRFGHAMDPDRGVLYFVNMLLGAQNTITEIQVNRPDDYTCRGGYKKLFDNISKENMLERYVKEIIEKGNVFTDENAIYVFKTALNIDDAMPFEKISEHNYFINDDDLLRFLNTHYSVATKSIFFLSTELQLTDKQRDVICSIKWNEAPIKNFINGFSADKFDITDISPLSMENVKEDIITFASVELYKKIKCKLLAVSYPGAQGDRCVLTGEGRAVNRTYIDIIAYKCSQNGIRVYLEECKDVFSKSKSDAIKLQEFKLNIEKQNGLEKLFHKIIDNDNFSTIYTSIAAKSSKVIPYLDVDYILMFEIENDNLGKTTIHYSVAIVDLALIDDFSLLKNEDKKFKGTIEMETIYTIK